MKIVGCDLHARQLSAFSLLKHQLHSKSPWQGF